MSSIPPQQVAAILELLMWRRAQCAIAKSQCGGPAAAAGRPRWLAIGDHHDAADTDHDGCMTAEPPGTVR
eukprot:1261928-Prymnesium_polylepis.1